MIPEVHPHFGGSEFPSPAPCATLAWPCDEDACAADMATAIAGAALPRGLFVESYPRAMYGQQQELLAMLERFPRDRAEPLVLVPGRGAVVPAVRRLGVRCLALAYPPLLSRYGGAIYRYNALRRIALGWQTLRYIWRARKRLRELRVSGVYCNDLRGLLTVGAAARSLHIPVMIWDKLDRPHGMLDLCELPLTNAVAFISEATKAKFSPRQLRRYAHRLHTIPDGADLPRFTAARANRQALGIDKDDVAIAVVGTVTHRKGQDRLLKILPQLLAAAPQALLLIVGAPSDSEADRGYLAGLPFRDHPRVRWLGQRSDIPEIMQSIDVLVAPSRHEGLGVVLLEAMACGKPVVGARTGGIVEVVVDGQSGWLVDGDNAQEVLAALTGLCHSEPLRRRMGWCGRERVARHFNRDVQMHKILALLLEMVAREGRRWP
jgi:glycosyltransferase involved in cell wall biosynthesis